MATKSIHRPAKHVTRSSASSVSLWYLALGVTLLVSLLPNIIWNETTGSTPPWLFGAKLVLLGSLWVVGRFWAALRPLRDYWLILLVLFIAEWLSGVVGATALWQSWFGSASFEVSMLGTQLLRFAAALVILVALFVMKRKRSLFYLTRGDLNARVEPVPWLGVKKPAEWRFFGSIAAFCISMGTLVFLLMAGLPQGDTLLKVFMTLPIILLFAAMNAFSEELNYRAALLTTLRDAVSPKQAVVLSALFFGIGHYYGVPYGMAGVVMASLLGWLLGKAMLETNGFLWPWLIHFFQDVLIFTFMAVGAVVAGGL